MNIENKGNPRPFVFDAIDPTTGVKRHVQKTIDAKGDSTLKQEDVSPVLKLARTIIRRSHIPGEDLASQELSKTTAEEIEIKKRDKPEISFRIFVTKYSSKKGEEVTIESLSFAKRLGKGNRKGRRVSLYIMPFISPLFYLTIFSDRRKKLNNQESFLAINDLNSSSCATG